MQETHCETNHFRRPDNRWKGSPETLKPLQSKMNWELITKPPSLNLRCVKPRKPLEPQLIVPVGQVLEGTTRKSVKPLQNNVDGKLITNPTSFNLSCVKRQENHDETSGLRRSHKGWKERGDALK